jgi:hypothetical protein
MLDVDGLPRKISRMPHRTHRKSFTGTTQATTKANKDVSKSDE